MSTATHGSLAISIMLKAFRHLCIGKIYYILQKIAHIFQRSTATHHVRQEPTLSNASAAPTSQDWCAPRDY
jgi:hypothetical protein